MEAVATGNVAARLKMIATSHRRKLKVMSMREELLYLLQQIEVSFDETFMQGLYVERPPEKRRCGCTLFSQCRPRLSQSVARCLCRSTVRYLEMGTQFGCSLTNHAFPVYITNNTSNTTYTHAPCLNVYYAVFPAPPFLPGIDNPFLPFILMLYSNCGNTCERKCKVDSDTPLSAMEGIPRIWGGIL